MYRSPTSQTTLSVSAGASSAKKRWQQPTANILHAARLAAVLVLAHSVCAKAAIAQTGVAPAPAPSLTLLDQLPPPPPQQFSPPAGHKPFPGDRFIIWPDENDPAYKRSKALAERYKQGDALRRKGDLNGAVVVYEALLKEEPLRLPSTRLGLARCYVALGKKEVALQHYGFLVAPPPELHLNTSMESSAPVLMEYAILLHQAGRYDAAFEVFTRGMKDYRGGFGPLLNQEVVNTQNATTAQLPFIAHLVACSELLGNGVTYADQSAAHAAEAVRLRPNQAIGHFYLGQAFRYQCADTRADVELHIQSHREFQTAARLGSGAVKRWAQSEGGRPAGEPYEAEHLLSR